VFALNFLIIEAQRKLWHYRSWNVLFCYHGLGLLVSYFEWSYMYLKISHPTFSTVLFQFTCFRTCDELSIYTSLNKSIWFLYKISQVFTAVKILTVAFWILTYLMHQIPPETTVCYNIPVLLKCNIDLDIWLHRRIQLVQHLRVHCNFVFRVNALGIIR
jgi:hypothetical protein